MQNRVGYDIKRGLKCEQCKYTSEVQNRLYSKLRVAYIGTVSIAPEFEIN